MGLKRLDETLRRAEKKSEANTRTSSTIDDPVETDAERKVRLFNQTQGREGYDWCPDCLGRGDIAVLQDGEMRLMRCHCIVKKQALKRVRRSGLGEMYDKLTMENYRPDADWQKKLKQKADEYLNATEGWFFVCGTPGSGKTHITCAIAHEMLECGREVRYMMWRQEAPRLKAMVNDRDEYERRMDDLIGCEVLVIDDLFKGKVSEADVNLAFELLNARYNSPSKRTIISSERDMADILAIDEAVGSRIAERARGYVLKTEDVNLRLR